VVLASLSFLWWMFVAPHQLGGPVTMAVVKGTSMLPEYQSGDLVVAYKQDSYLEGDNVIYERFGGYVIHKIVDTNPDGSFKTRGVNNKFPDTWTVPKQNVYGKQIFVAPGLGQAIQDTVTNPIAAGLLSLLVAVLVILPTRRTRLYGDAKRLHISKATEKVKFRGHRTILFWALAFIFVSVLGILTALLMSQSQFWPRVAISLAAFIVFGALLLGYSIFLFDGEGLTEPSKSMVILGPLFFRLKTDDVLHFKVIEVNSALELRKLKEQLKTTVLHRVTDKGVHEFYVCGHGENFVHNFRPPAP
jgi:signal peptidase I